MATDGIEAEEDFVAVDDVELAHRRGSVHAYLDGRLFDQAELGEFSNAAAELRVRQVAVEVSGRLETRAYPKSRAGVRTVPTPTFLLEMVKARFAGRDPDAELVFGTAVDTPVRRSNFRRQVWVPAVVRSGLPPRLRFHDLRHSYATWLISDGVPVNVVRRSMGHEQMTTTLNRDA